MSADIMPCGCEGHFDKEHLCRFPALRAERDALRVDVSLLKESERDLSIKKGRVEAELAEARAERDRYREALAALVDTGSTPHDDGAAWDFALSSARLLLGGKP